MVDTRRAARRAIPSERADELGSGTTRRAVVSRVERDTKNLAKPNPLRSARDTMGDGDTRARDRTRRRFPAREVRSESWFAGDAPPRVNLAGLRPAAFIMQAMCRVQWERGIENVSEAQRADLGKIRVWL